MCQVRIYAGGLALGAAMTRRRMSENRVTERGVLVQCATMIIGMLLIRAYSWCLTRRRTAASAT